ncbi:MAG TPA: hypothetical protein VFZ09_33455 [Archangium sp.]|uniref:hypothetical protein n=1 Tax=Archangium sp. TaxID=1872627 RepID=UPI002E363442|nr:hypothetical protein [Archangium sp.]HEX5751179.1 hypothetical protein [Archangium sp.]
MIGRAEWAGGGKVGRIGGWACAMTALAGSAVLLWPRPPEPSAAKHASTVAETALSEPLLFLDQGNETPVVIGYPLPEAPFPGQRKPPCEPPSEELHGHCWVRIAHALPCPRGTGVHEGGCYLPVSDNRPAPRQLLPCEEPRALTRWTCC